MKNQINQPLKQNKRGKHKIRWTAIITTFIAAVFYILLFILLYPNYGMGVSALITLSVVAASWLWGVKNKKESKYLEDNFLTTIKAIPHGMLIVNTDGYITLANEQAEHVFGYESGTLLGIEIEQLVPTHQRHHHVSHRITYHNHPQSRQMIGRELMAQRRDGSRFPAQVGLNPMKTSDGVSILVSIIDISEQKRSEAQRQSLIEIMQAAVETSNLHEYLTHVHDSLKRALSADNYFVILKNKTTGLFEEVYSADKFDLPLPPQVEMKRSASSYVYRTGQSLLLTEERFDQLVTQGEMELIGNNSLSWLGVPLKIGGEPIGVMVVQDYENEGCYSERDEEFLASTAGQVALAIERKRAEEELRASQKHFYELFENVPVGIWEEDFSAIREFLYGLFESGITDLSTYFDDHPEAVTECVNRIKVVNVNQAALQFYQAEDKSQLIDKTTSPIRIDSQSFRVFREQFIELAHGHTSYETEFDTLNMRGEMRTVALRLSFAYGSEQTWKRVFVAFTDLTERKHAEQAMRDAEFRYQQIVERIPAVVYSAGLGPDMHWKFVSPQIQDLLGYTAEEWLADPQIWQDCLHPSDRQLVTEVEMQSKATGEPVKLEYRMFTRDGRMIWVRDEATVARDENGNSFLSLGFIFDITERKLAEEQASRRADEFAMLYDTAHHLAQSQGDLKSVLQVIGNRAASLLGSSAAGFYLYDAAHGDLNLAVRVGNMFPPGIVRLKIGQGASGMAAQNRTTIIVDDYATWEHRSDIFDGLDINAVLCVPMLYSREMIGVLTIGETGNSKRKYTEAEARLLELFASQAAAAIYNARLLENTFNRLNELETIARVSGRLRAANSLNEMLPGLLDETLNALNTDTGSIFLYDPEIDALRSRLQRGWFRVAEQQAQVPADSIAAYVYSSGEVYHSKDAAQNQGEIPDGWDAVCVPIRTSQEVVGVLFISVQKPRELTADEVRLLTTLAEIAGNAIHRTRLHEQTKRNLIHISMLRQIDQTIASNFDLSVSLNLLINNAMAQLKAGAVCILRLNPSTQMLEYLNGQGFLNEEIIKRARLRLGEKYAGLAALERRQISISDLSSVNQSFANSEFARSENIRAYHANPLIAKGEVKGVLEVFHHTPFHPDEEWLDLMETLAGQAALAIDNAELFKNLQQSNQELTFAYDNTIEGWSRALDLRDRETEGHTQRVTEMTMQLANAIGLKTEELVHIHRGALLHDIGKMGVPDHILLKPGKLTASEWKVMRQHPVYAYEMLQPIAYLRPALEIPYSHHERWDGSGYPRALKGEEIPLAARIFSVVDVWDALLSNRPYRRAWERQRVIKYIESFAGKYFDPNVVTHF
ncbi:GAF domain-containing protein [Candidatus Villigracilis affinis]|uniref:GAF domain-containing protein n=1 Tax=Candidatus Villigracilis affinis TaxID=3140682 RepID=UPI002A1979CD|nr:GAF domain-containing protein [Anaerolineales bacterium]